MIKKDKQLIDKLETAVNMAQIYEATKDSVFRVREIAESLVYSTKKLADEKDLDFEEAFEFMKLAVQMAPVSDSIITVNER